MTNETNDRRAHRVSVGMLTMMMVGLAPMAAVAQWDMGPPLPAPRSGHTATTLPSGEVLVVGGRGVRDVLILDPDAGAWRVVAALPAPSGSAQAPELFDHVALLLATRPDILPPDVINQLKLLQDRVPPVPFGELRAELEAELGAPLSEVFAHFDETPLASASVAQVHRARLVVDDHTDEVVLKIQRPNIRDTVERDIELLYLLARAIERSIPEARIYSPVGLVTEFDRAISDELDFTREADHAERFSRAFAGDPHVKFPRVYRELTRKKVLVMELLAGLHVSDALAAGYSGERMAKRLLHALFKQIYEDGFFHGDPHPGNIMILGTPEEPVIGFLDLGLVGRMSPEMRDHTVDLMVAAARQDVRGIADALYAIGTPTKRIDRQRYEAEVAVLAEKYLGKPLKDIALSALIRDIVGGAVKYGLEIPPEFLMLGRTLMTVEGVGKQLYPELDVYSEAPCVRASQRSCLSCG
jgi:ubiquinone biosynthesis protein